VSRVRHPLDPRQATSARCGWFPSRSWTCIMFVRMRSWRPTGLAGSACNQAVIVL